MAELIHVSRVKIVKDRGRVTGSCLRLKEGARVRPALELYQLTARHHAGISEGSSSGDASRTIARDA